jgi:hypothetical protein
MFMKPLFGRLNFLANSHGNDYCNIVLWKCQLCQFCWEVNWLHPSAPAVSIFSQSSYKVVRMFVVRPPTSWIMENSPGSANSALVCFTWITPLSMDQENTRVRIQNEGFPPHILRPRDRKCSNGEKYDLGRSPEVLHKIILSNWSCLAGLLLGLQHGMI